tara:strand:+ start:186 stop:542 length:357 start_codon:yes stop_codon:yes gene_type:complete
MARAPVARKRCVAALARAFDILGPERETAPHCIVSFSQPITSHHGDFGGLGTGRPGSGHVCRHPETVAERTAQNASSRRDPLEILPQVRNASSPFVVQKVCILWCKLSCIIGEKIWSP